MLPAVERFGLGFFPFFPLHNGLLTGKFTRSGGPEDSRIMMQRQHVWQNAPWDALEQYQEFCDERGHHDAGGDVRLAAVAPGALERDRRCHERRAGAGERGRRRTRGRPSDADLALIDVLFPLVEDPAARV